jgi:hypothetical protein
MNNEIKDDVKKLTEAIMKYFPKFFDDFDNWQYGTGVDAGKDFKRIYNRAKRIHKLLKQQKQSHVQ